LRLLAPVLPDQWNPQVPLQGFDSTIFTVHLELAIVIRFHKLQVGNAFILAGALPLSLRERGRVRGELEAAVKPRNPFPEPVSFSVVAEA